MKSIAIIPARSGSKRIKNKNKNFFLGKPIIQYAIEAALESTLFDTVMVSTDSVEIKIIAESLGAEVPFLRTRKNSDDHATTFDVLKEVLDTYRQKDMHFEYGCCIYPTAVFTTGTQLERYYDFLISSTFDCVFPVLKYSYPIQRALTLSPSRKMTMLQPQHIETRSQDLEATYHDAGQFYWFKVVELLSFGKLWTDNTGALEISEYKAHDIDTLEDWRIAEIKYQANKELNSQNL